MIVPIRRTVWSAAVAGSTLGADKVFNTLWSGLRADVAGFRLEYWAIVGQGGGVKRTVAAQASTDGESWTGVGLDPAPTAETGAGWFGPDGSYAPTNWRFKYLRIGLWVEANQTPTGSVFQTIDGTLTLIGEAL